MTLDQIVELAREGESETVEFKRTIGELDTAGRAVCAMLNHRGGQVLFGVTESPPAVTGQEVGARTLERIAQRLREIEPPAFPTIEQVPTASGRMVIVVTVSAGENRPYSIDGRAYRRVGSTNQALTQTAYEALLLERLHGVQRWENQPVPAWSVADLDANAIRRTVQEAVQRGRLADPGTLDPEGLLRGLGMLRDGLPLRAAVVLFGLEERLAAEFPQCKLRLARFRGSDRTEFVDNRQVYGNAFTLLSSAESFVREHNPIAGRVVATRIERVDEPLYPPLAVREALANALCHRDYTLGGGSVAIGIYDDRLEVTSSGALHFGLTPEKLFEPHESLPWNPLIARVFYRYGVIEEWGRGTIKMAEIAAASNLAAPEIEDAGGCVTVRFRPRRYVPPERVQRAVTERQRAILALLDEAPDGLALREIAAKLEGGPTSRQVRLDLDLLRALELAYSSGRGRGARWWRSG